MGVYHRAAFDQEVHQAWIAVIQHAESARPPLGTLPDVGARTQEYIDCRPIAALYCREQGVLAEAVIGQRIVDPGPQFRVTIEDLADSGCIVLAHCSLQRLCRSEAERFDV